MKLEVDFLFKIIRYLLNNEKEKLHVPHDSFEWKLLFKFAERHSILNLVYYGVMALPEEERPDGEVYNDLYQYAMQEIAKCYNQIEAVKTLFGAFEQAGVDALAVKGICTKHHYPQVDMRSMGDVDILYREEQHGQMKQVMLQLEYQLGMEGRKHDHYFSNPFVSLEMHRALVPSDSRYSAYYEHVWDRLKLKEGHQYIYEMCIEDEYIYTLVHLAEHFQRGGIGIRFVIDVYVYDKMEELDWTYIETELKQLGLWEFYRNISRLAHTWFGGEAQIEEKETNDLEEMATYIIANGTFGTAKNAAAVSVGKKGRINYLITTIFPNMKNMQSMFPWLKKWPILLPYSWILRIVRSMRFRRKNIKIHFEQYKYGDKEYGEKLNQFFKSYGL